MQPNLRRRKPASLMFRVGWVSALLIGLLAVVLTSWLSNFIRSNEVSHTQDNATFAMGTTLAFLQPKETGGAAITAAQYAEVTRLFNAMVATGKFVGATAWTPTGVVGYANEVSRLGHTEKLRPQAIQALAGRTTSVIVSKPLAGVPAAAEGSAMRADGPLLEVFVPVKLGGRVVAVVGLYQKWRPVQQSIDRAVTRILILVIGGVLLLWLALIHTVRGASRKLREQAELNLLLASHDPLTGQPNRSLLLERVNLAIGPRPGAGHPFALMVLDLDRFKAVNDTLGHRYGDMLLQQVGPRLESVLREGDFVARIGGDEFVVLLTEFDAPSRAVVIAERIVAVIAMPFELDGHLVLVAASVGIATSPEHGADFEALMQHADSAMYSAKTSGTGYCVYEATKDDALTGGITPAQLRWAVTKSPDQIVVHYQPKAHLLTGEVRGVEALVRWQHPQLGLIAPGEFIPLAEQSGLIHPLTAIVLSQALQQIKVWSQLGLRLQTAVNIAAGCLDNSLPRLVERLLREHAVAAELLELEVTESAIMNDPTRSAKVLAELHEMGVKLSIDDFGTGYSSMTHLRNLPFDEIKIDRSFITDMAENPVDAGIVAACLTLGQRLGLTVVAEGVETAEVWHQLAEAGCELAQGHYLARAMPPEALADWMLDREHPERPLRALVPFSPSKTIQRG
jgi:diguanylate cyclase (GGDEF)-like protein